MDTHVKVLAVLDVVMGACGVVTALFLMLLFSGIAGAIGLSGDADALVAIPILGAVGTGVSALILVTSLPAVIVGYGLWKRQAWARIGGIVVAILSLLWIPWGTILGAYGLWVLFNKDTERLFATPAGPTPAS